MLAKPIAYSLPTKTVGITLAGATTMTVETVGGHIPTLAAGEYTYGILSDDETFTDPDALYETVKITAITGSDLTVERNAESTNGAQEWADGTAIMVGITAVAWEELDAAITNHIAEDDTDDVHGYKTYTDGLVRGFKNAIINGDFRINQRGHLTGGTLAAGAYAHDRWKSITADTDYTFSTTENKTTITIPATKEVAQIIEGGNLVSADYTLSWEGTAQGKIGAGAYADSPITASITGGTDLTITFGEGTVANVQLEAGSVATLFEQRPIGLELSLCCRYYQKSFELDTKPQKTTGRAAWRPPAVAYVTTNATIQIFLGIRMRVAPTVTTYSNNNADGGLWNIYVDGTLDDATATTPSNINESSFVVNVAQSLTRGYVYQASGEWTADAEL